jgi:hypothetical protein
MAADSHDPPVALARPRTPCAPWAFLCLVLAACGAAAQPFRVVDATDSPGASWVHDADLEERTSAVARIAAAMWGGAEMEGWTVRFVTEIESCGRARSSGEKIMGCTRPREKIIDVRVDPGSPCVEGTAILHELGHVALPDDPEHSDPRWSSGQFWTDLLSDVEREIAEDDPLCAETVAAWQLWWAGQ